MEEQTARLSNDTLKYHLQGCLLQCCCHHQKPTEPQACRILHHHELQNTPYPNLSLKLSCPPAQKKTTVTCNAANLNNDEDQRCKVINSFY